MSALDDAVVVGVPGEVGAGAFGAAYVFLRIGNAWLTDGILVREGPAGSTCFAHATSMAESIIAVGAPCESHPDVIDGSAYVFERSIDGQWAQTARLIANQIDMNGNQYDYFGWAVSADVNRVLVGAYNDPPDGAAYVFDRSESGDWAQTARLVPGDPLAWYFGESVALSGDIAVIGAPNDFEQADYAGSTYVFERGPDGQWHQRQKLLPALGHPFQRFGAAVAVDDEIILVGASADNLGAPWAGAVYVFECDQLGDWIQTARLAPPDLENSNFFGVSVALDGDLCVVGAENYNGALFDAGAAFVFQRQPDGTWIQLATLTADDPQGGSEFGRAVAVSGNVALVGAPYFDALDPAGQPIRDTGAAYAFAVGPDTNGDGVMDVCQCRAAGDLDFSGVIDLSDLVLLLSSFGLDPGGDLDVNGETNLQDLAQLLANWSLHCP